ncbi:8-oxo-dGTP pyrophosphatase MutT (NUDIX family) [Sinobaca qinghaiensis]|uniref:8-oxo-dGTP pyrophosphatase MutT (NUDIX family) n=1 Tax=Sinobaca qinghaiensis TaxID=342944 RepID=A0A419V3P3_9BACL|nr:CoA pyrophosphatase [Sinobaca qinghaiensis]RKD73072.1 8-oxo-dGTP pyrophosphatase MutT (NUDIX family) [Sinobaca qinghaiensis]
MNQLDHMFEQIKNRPSRILGEDHFHKSAVMIPIIEKEGTPHVLFEVRAEHMNSQPGEICFPGGRVDAEDANEEEACIREVMEEIGVTRQDITLAGSLDTLVTPYNHMIYSFAGHISKSAVLSPNPAEVGELFTVPLSYFHENPPVKHNIYLQVQPEDTFPYSLIPGGENYSWRTATVPEYFYEYNDYIIWGLTARLLRHFLQVTAS